MRLRFCVQSFVGGFVVLVVLGSCFGMCVLASFERSVSKPWVAAVTVALFVLIAVFSVWGLKRDGRDCRVIVGRVGTT
jgi:hypothetical protein